MRSSEERVSRVSDKIIDSTFTRPDNSSKQNSPATANTSLHSAAQRKSFGEGRTGLAREEEGKGEGTGLISSFAAVMKERMPNEASVKGAASEMSSFQLVGDNQERVKYLRNKISKESLSKRNSTESTISKENEAHRSNLGRSDVLPATYSIIKIMSHKAQGKRTDPESPLQDNSMEKYRNGNLFRCVHCAKLFKTGQALGGHMSRKHAGKSSKYNHKKEIRQTREFERVKLQLAKKKFFDSLGYDYDSMMETPEGKMKAKSLINRSKIKRIKSHLTEKEVSNYFKG
eukprot:TRINITY_DN12360_c0_g2_i2.p1 TRINITY_DN12360_c0_g2~~TRINITY_DN12360_c0_g2_i2.p1  ORF type:complete len:287 (+),score=16.37 TRINITY_DN12360_c0_g2_i2:186-1046(+)